MIPPPMSIPLPEDMSHIVYVISDECKKWIKANKLSFLTQIYIQIHPGKDQNDLRIHSDQCEWGFVGNRHTFLNLSLYPTKLQPEGQIEIGVDDPGRSERLKQAEQALLEKHLAESKELDRRIAEYKVWSTERLKG